MTRATYANVLRSERLALRYCLQCHQTAACDLSHVQFWLGWSNQIIPQHHGRRTYARNPHLKTLRIL